MKFRRFHRLWASTEPVAVSYVEPQEDEPEAKGDEHQAWRETLESRYPGNPFELARAACDDIEEQVERLRVDRNATTDERQKAKLDRKIAHLEEQTDRLWPIAHPAFIGRTTGRDERIRPEAEQLYCRVTGCFYELRDKSEASKTGRRCPRHFAEATTRVVPESRPPGSQAEQVVDSVLKQIGGE